MEGFVNSKAAVEALEFYKSLYDCCTPPGYTDSYMQEGLDAFKSGQVAMMMNWFAFFPGLYKDPDVGGDKIGFFVNPKQKVEASHAGRPGHLGGQLLARSRKRRSQYIKWFAQPEVQKKWWALGGYSASNAVLLDPGFPATAPFAADFLKAMSGVKDFWQEPAYASLMLSMQKRVHDYVVAGQGTAQEAADAMVEGLDRGVRGRGQALASSDRDLPGRSSLAAGEVPLAPHRLAARQPDDRSQQHAPIGRPGRRRDAWPAGRARARAVGPGDRLAVHHADDRAAARDQHLPADLDDPALVHELPRQPAERAGRCGWACATTSGC